MTPTVQSISDLIRAIADTLAPSLEPPVGADDATVSFYRNGAIARGIDVAVADALEHLDQPVRGAVDELAHWLGGRDFTTADLLSRTALLHEAASTSMRLRLGVRQLKAMVLGSFVGAVDATGTNPTWEAIGYPGPATPPPTAGQAPKNIPITTLEPGVDELCADVVIVGSGAGGAVVAARAAQAGLDVLVLEMGGYKNESDFRQIDSLGAEMFLRRGSLWSGSGQIGVLAGSTLGGGTVINSMVCLRTPDRIRESWAESGLDGLDGPEWDKHVDAVWSRIGVNTDATRYNANTRAMVTGLTSQGYTYERLPRNAALDDESSLCGFCNAGCQRGHKRTMLHTYLDDAVRAGARVLVGAHADRVLSEDGVARGVEATVSTPDGERTITIEAPHVVVAAGGIESPALLLRSGIGGPAVGKNLTLHPAWIVTGVYEEPVEAWHGQIQSAVSFDLTQAVSGGGFLVESLALNPGTWAGQSPFVDGRTTRDQLTRLPYFATWHGVSHDHGSGEVYLEDGEAAVRWALDDEVDHRIAVRAHVELAQMHRAAGATEIFTFHWSDLRWREGESFEDYLENLRTSPADDHTAFSAHQMSACRLGADPATSVADGHGQLHDTQGVWIGDGSALPTAPGVNPMITIMAMAERTAAELVRAAAAVPIT